MKTFRGMILIVDSLIVVVGAVLAVSFHLVPDWTAEVVPIWATPSRLPVAGIVAIAVHLVYLCSEVVHHAEKRRFIPITGDSGGIRISIQAVEESLERTLMMLRQVRSIRVKVFVPGAGSKTPIRVFARGTLWDDPALSSTTLRAQQLLKERFLEMVEIEPEPTFELQWDNFKQRSVSKKQKVKEKVSDTLFRGPQYPVHQ